MIDYKKLAKDMIDVWCEGDGEKVVAEILIGLGLSKDDLKELGFEDDVIFYAWREMNE